MTQIVSLAFWMAITALTACASLFTDPEETTLRADAVLRDAAGREIGSVSFTQGEGGVRVKVAARGLTPGAHGIHLHAVGACDGSTSPAFSSAGGHFNPGGKQHGHHNPAGWHVGDLPNLVADPSGSASLAATAEGATLGEGAGSLFDADGTAVVVHANEDDLRTDSGPAGPGNSGARIACGVVERR